MPYCEFETDWRTLHVLPVLTFVPLVDQDDPDGEIYGIGLTTGWLFFMIKIGFEFSGK